MPDGKNQNSVLAEDYGNMVILKPTKHEVALGTALNANSTKNLFISIGREG